MHIRMGMVFNSSEFSHTDHHKFGGMVYESDFNTNFHDSYVVQRIITDTLFDIQCVKNAKFRDKNEKYKREKANGKDDI